MVMPASEATSLEVIQAKLAFEVLVDALGAPALLDGSNQVFHGDLPRQRCEVVLGRRRFTVGPLRDQPHVLTDRRGDAIVVKGDDASGSVCRYVTAWQASRNRANR